MTLISVVETETYLSRARRMMSDTEREAIVTMVAANPTAGDLIPGSGGLRKMRIPLEGRGKRGGGRVIYWFHDMHLPAVLLFVFAKNEASDLTPDQAKALARLVENMALDFGG